MLVTLSGMVMLAKLGQYIKASSPMLVTVLPVRSRLTYLAGAPRSAVLMVGNSSALLTLSVMSWGEEVVFGGRVVRYDARVSGVSSLLLPLVFSSFILNLLNLIYHYNPTGLLWFTSKIIYI
jgi:type IV secretory pathway TrbD component